MTATLFTLRGSGTAEMEDAHLERMIRLRNH